MARLYEIFYKKRESPVWECFTTTSVLKFLPKFFWLRKHYPIIEVWANSSEEDMDDWIPEEVVPNAIVRGRTWIWGERGSRKTLELLKRTNRLNAVILTENEQRAHFLTCFARRVGLTDFRGAYSFRDWPRRSIGYRNPILVDDALDVLEDMLNVKIYGAVANERTPD